MRTPKIPGKGHDSVPLHYAFRARRLQRPQALLVFQFFKIFNAGGGVNELIFAPYRDIKIAVGPSAAWKKLF